LFVEIGMYLRHPLMI